MPEAQRIAVAEACGWLWTGSDLLKQPDVCLWCRDGNSIFHRLPDYLGDLNACHEMEDSLTVNEWTPYLDWLEKICVPVHICPTSHGLAMVMAPASQRVEAFLRTKGLWETSDPTDPTGYY